MTSLFYVIASNSFVILNAVKNLKLYCLYFKEKSAPFVISLGADFDLSFVNLSFVLLSLLLFSNRLYAAKVLSSPVASEYIYTAPGTPK